MPWRLADVLGELSRFQADCSRCQGLCCVALSRSRAGGFGDDAAAGVPCHHLRTDDLCSIHATLRRDGWPACTVFDCSGAGQQVTRVTFAAQTAAGRSWRSSPKLAAEIFSAFHVLRPLMEMARHLTEASRLEGVDPREVAPLLTELDALLGAAAPDLRGVDVRGLHERTAAVLSAASAAHRRGMPGPQRRLRRRLVPGAQLFGADLHGADLSGASLRGAYLIAADLRGCRLERTELLGTDLRDADLRGADLSAAFFLTPQQLASARGDATTALPVHLARPRHWND